MPRIDAPTLAEHHAQRRASLVAAAVDVLHREGPAAVTPAAVASAAGLARSSVYQYYPSTGALVAAAVEEMFERSADSITGAIEGAATPRERLGAYVGAAVDAAVAGHFPTASLASLDMGDACFARIADLHDALVTPLVDTLRDLGVDDPEATAGLVNGVIGAAAAQVQRGGPVDAVRRRTTEFVLGAVARG